jgi:hypothetical protein
VKIKLYIVAYNNDEALNNCLQSLEDTTKIPIEIFVINNYSQISINPKYKLTLLNNSLRPDFSTGHLSRNWNQAIINGFRDLNSPDCDILVTCQDDTIFCPNWLENTIRYHQTYSLITNGIGDNFVSYTVDAIKKIGIWDERFCNVGYQEADYFTRSLIFNRDKSSVNDHGHQRVWNPIPETLVYRPGEGFLERSKVSFAHHSISFQVFKLKYPHLIDYKWNEDGNLEKVLNTQKLAIPTFMYYPYFEKSIEDLPGKGYITL